MRRRLQGLAMGALLALLPGAAGAAPAGESAFEDENIVRAAVARINAARLGNAHVNAVSFHRYLLLTGEVPSAAVRSQVEQAVAGIAGVDGVDDELVVGPISGISARTRDSWITSDVKFRLLKKGLGSDVIRVVVENGAVFLMGSVTRKDGAAAAEVASGTDHVERVVLVFHYLD